MQNLTTLETVLSCIIAWIYFVGLILSVQTARSENARESEKMTTGACILWPFMVTYACVTVNKGRGL